MTVDVEPAVRLAWHRDGSCPGCGCHWGMPTDPVAQDVKPIAEGVWLCFCCNDDASPSRNAVILEDLATAANR